MGSGREEVISCPTSLVVGMRSCQSPSGQQAQIVMIVCAAGSERLEMRHGRSVDTRRGMTVESANVHKNPQTVKNNLGGKTGRERQYGLESSHTDVVRRCESTHKLV